MRRGGVHLHAIHELAKRFNDREPYRIIEQTEPESGWQILYVEIREEPPLELGLILGDLLHNWRSALDCLAHELVRHNGRSPDRRIAFPILADPDKFREQSQSRLRGMSEAHKQAIEELQPYPGRDKPRGEALRIVNALANLDRHQTIHPTYVGLAATPENPPIKFRSGKPLPRDNISIEVQIPSLGQQLTDGAELMRLRLGVGPDEEVDVKGELFVEIAFGERSPVRLNALAYLGIEVWQTIQIFAPDFT